MLGSSYVTVTTVSIITIISIILIIITIFISITPITHCPPTDTLSPGNSDTGFKADGLFL